MDLFGCFVILGIIGLIAKVIEEESDGSNSNESNDDQLVVIEKDGSYKEK